jgi:hypothetical protein
VRNSRASRQIRHRCSSFDLVADLQVGMIFQSHQALLQGGDWEPLSGIQPVHKYA